MKWLMALDRAFSALTAPPDGPPHRFARFDIGVCPRCRGLRSMASLRCSTCGSTRPVSADA